MRFTINDPVFGQVDEQFVEVQSVMKDGVRFRLEDGSSFKFAEGAVFPTSFGDCRYATISNPPFLTSERIL